MISDHCLGPFRTRPGSEQPKNNLLFWLQPAEENEAGGMLMYEDGAFGDQAQTSFMDPCSSGFESYQIQYTHLFAGTCEVKIRFKGKGGTLLFHRGQ